MINLGYSLCGQMEDSVLASQLSWGDNIRFALGLANPAHPTLCDFLRDGLWDSFWESFND